MPRDSWRVFCQDPAEIWAARNFASCRDSWHESRRILVTRNISSLRAVILGRTLNEIQPRFWPPGIHRPIKILGENHAEIPTEILAAGNSSSRRDSWRESRQDPAEILAAGNSSSHRDSWREARKDHAEILAAGKFASRLESRRDSRREPCQDSKFRRPKSRRDSDWDRGRILPRSQLPFYKGNEKLFAGLTIDHEREIPDYSAHLLFYSYTVVFFVQNLK